jgi:4-azaleucine resistance transporter AzlC
MSDTTGRGTSFLREGVSGAWPICLGYIPIGLSFGLLAQKGGLATWQVAVMSVAVFAGGSQFIAVAMISAGASAAAIISTTFMVNLRHLLMSSALALHLTGVSRRFLLLFAYGITDESFGINMARFSGEKWDHRSALVLNQAANATWIVSTVFGSYLGQFIPSGALGLEFALTSMFICLLVFQLRGLVFTATAILAAFCSVVAYLWLPGNSYVIVASCTAATAGYFIKRLLRRREALS